MTGAQHLLLLRRHSKGRRGAEGPRRRIHPRNRRPRLWTGDLFQGAGRLRGATLPAAIFQEPAERMMKTFFLTAACIALTMPAEVLADDGAFDQLAKQYVDEFPALHLVAATRLGRLRRATNGRARVSRWRPAASAGGAEVVLAEHRQHRHRPGDPRRRHEPRGGAGADDRIDLPGRAGGGRQMGAGPAHLHAALDQLRRIPGAPRPARGSGADLGPGVHAQALSRSGDLVRLAARPVRPGAAAGPGRSGGGELKLGWWAVPTLHQLSLSLAFS